MSRRGSYGRHSIGRVLWRYCTGNALDGSGGKTNGTWLFKGIDTLPHVVRATRWSYLAGWQRMLWRWFLTWACFASLWAWALHRTAVIRILWTLLAVITIAAGGIGVHVWRKFRHTQQVVRPILRSVARPAGLPPNPPNPGKHLIVPKNYQTDTTSIIRLRLDPNTWSGSTEQKTAVGGTITRRLGHDWDATWMDSAAEPFVTWKRSPVPPGTVTLSDLLPLMEKATDGTPVLGLGTRRQVITLDLDNEAPHVAFSIGTGGGKSSTLRLVIAQLVRQGVEVILIDPKRISLNEFRGVPGITIHRDIQDQVRAVQEFRAEMENRYQRLDVDESWIPPRKVLVVEEGNSFQTMGQDYWNGIREKSDPKTPPWVSDWNFILFQGRQARMNVLAVYQQMNAKASGGSAARDQFGTKVLARFSIQTWAFLVGTFPRAKSSRHDGRAIIVTGGEEYQTVQVGFLAPQEARAYALGDAAETPAEEMSTHGTAARSPLRVVGTARMSLREAIEQERLPMEYEAAKRARTRDPDFPDGVRGRDGVTRYTETELLSWFRNRPRTAIAVSSAGVATVESAEG